MLLRKYLTLVLACLGMLTLTADTLGQGADMRECPLDRITFIDPWAGGHFEVRRVGVDHTYRCESDWADEPIDGEACSRFGRTVLEGQLAPYEGDVPKIARATYHVEPAAPCCGWTLQDGAEQAPDGITWVEGAGVPRLGEVGFAVVDPAENGIPGADDTNSAFGNPKYALLCRSE